MKKRKVKLILKHRIKALGIEIPLKEALDLVKEDWVLRIEEDKEVLARIKSH
ncbi:MAG TPA: hypothetical protein VIH20_00190 [Candidatus Subteraquimicrobiales bacterium]